MSAALIEQLSHPDGTVRREAAIALGASADAAAVPALLERLASETDTRVLEDLTWATVQHVDAALPGLLAMLSSGVPAARRQAAHVLSKVGDPAHLAAITPLVYDAEPDVAIKAYRAAANTGDVAALGPLAGSLGDGDAAQRDALTGAFHTFGEAAVPVLIGALSDADADVRLHAADALAHIGTPDADPAAEALGVLVDDPERAVRLAAVMAIGELGEVADAALAALAAGPDAEVAGLASGIGEKRKREAKKRALQQRLRAARKG